MEKNVRMALLFDFYGELLTDHQRECFSLYYDENLTLSEIAENSGISRQAVRDMVSRSETILEDYEAKTGLLARFTEMQSDIEGIRECLGEIGSLNDSKFKSEALSEICGRISARLERMSQ